MGSKHGVIVADNVKRMELYDSMRVVRLKKCQRKGLGRRRMESLSV